MFVANVEARERPRKGTKFCSEILNGTYLIEDIGLDWRIITKWMLKK
jgi:hypothetical protein